MESEFSVFLYENYSIKIKIRKKKVKLLWVPAKVVPLCRFFGQHIDPCSNMGYRVMAN